MHHFRSSWLIHFFFHLLLQWLLWPAPLSSFTQPGSTSPVCAVNLQAPPGGLPVEAVAGLPLQFSSVQSLSRVQLFVTPMDGSTPGLPVHHQLLEFTKAHVHWVGDAIQPSHPLSSPSSPAFNLSQHQGLFQWVSSLHQVAKCWSFSFSIRTSNEYSGLISFRMNWLDLLAVQETPKSLLQQHSTEASILQHSISLQSNFHIHIWLSEKPELWLDGPLSAK